jgi:hypothetical protein
LVDLQDGLGADLVEVDVHQLLAALVVDREARGL